MVTDVPSVQTHVLVPSITDVPAATYVNGQFCGLQLDSRASWVIHTDDATYLRMLAQVAGEAADRAEVAS